MTYVNRVLGCSPDPDGRMPKLLEGPYLLAAPLAALELEPTAHSHGWSQVSIETHW